MGGWAEWVTLHHGRPIPSMLLDPEGRVLDVNRTCLGYLARTRDHVRGRRLDGLLAPTDGALVQAHLEDVLAGKARSLDLEVHFRERRGLVRTRLVGWRLDGGATVVMLLPAPLHDRDDDPLDLLRATVEQSGDVVWISSRDFRRLLYFGDRAQALWGLSPAHVLASPRTVVELVHDADRVAVVNAFRLARSGPVEHEFRVVLHPAGEIRWVRQRMFPLPARDGNGRLVAGIARDMTDDRTSSARLGRRAAARLATAGLTRTERKIVEALAARVPLKAVAVSSGTSVRVTNERRRRALRKLGVRTLTQLRQLLRTADSDV